MYDATVRLDFPTLSKCSLYAITSATVRAGTLRPVSCTHAKKPATVRAYKSRLDGATS